MKKQIPKNRTSGFHITFPPRMEGKVREAMMIPVRKPKQSKLINKISI